MIPRTFIPSILLGVIGFGAGLATLILDQTSLGLAAGILGLGAGLTTLGLSRSIAEETRRRELIEEELRDVKERAAASEEALRELADKSELEDKSSSVDDSTKSPPANTDPLLDSTTGLFSENFFQVALDTRIASARRHLRPISVVLLDVRNAAGTDNSNDIASAIKETIRDADTACRMDSGEFALVLEDTPETGAIWTVERIRRNITDTDETNTLWAGVACYPAHAFSREDIISTAKAALNISRDWEQGRIEVAETLEEE